jgi:hypothetical protein
MIPERKLNYWINTRKNVLLTGHAGVGKSSIILDAWKRAGIKYLYFSVPTMDPWVDFIGIPKEAVTQEGQKYLELIRPLWFAQDKVEAIFLDEFNRGAEKVRNAVLELIQFRSINGFKFNNLKMIWAAINPDDAINTYDVQRLDPAQSDRFEIHYEVPYDLNLEYFTEKYGRDLACKASKWWSKLDTEKKYMVSPRRLDYALTTHLEGGDLEDVIPVNVNPTELHYFLTNESVQEKVEMYIRSGNKNGIKEILSNHNHFTTLINWISEEPTRREYFVDLLPPERLSELMHKGDEWKIAYGAVYNRDQDDTLRRFLLSQKDIFKSVCKFIKIPFSNKLGTNPIAPFQFKFDSNIRLDSSAKYNVVDIYAIAQKGFHQDDMHIFSELLGKAIYRTNGYQRIQNRDEIMSLLNGLAIHQKINWKTIEGWEISLSKIYRDGFEEFLLIKDSK